jgi:hypothetical protein
MAWCFALRIQRCLYEELSGGFAFIVYWRIFIFYLVFNRYPCNLKHFKGYFGPFSKGKYYD